jgi:hypothetical protein
VYGGDGSFEVHGAMIYAGKPDAEAFRASASAAAALSGAVMKKGKLGEVTGRLVLVAGGHVFDTVTQVGDYVVEGANGVVELARECVRGLVDEVRGGLQAQANAVERLDRLVVELHVHCVTLRGRFF